MSMYSAPHTSTAAFSKVSTLGRFSIKSRSAGCRWLDSGKAQEVSGRPGLFCYVKAEIQEVTLLLCIKQI
jgi:hypothetical protein